MDSFLIGEIFVCLQLHRKPFNVWGQSKLTRFSKIFYIEYAKDNSHVIGQY